MAQITVLSTKPALIKGLGKVMVETLHCGEHRQDIRYRMQGAMKIISSNAFWAKKPRFLS